MTIKPEVLAAIKGLDGVHDQRFAPWRNQWQTIRDELLAMDAEIERLNAGCKQHLRQAMENGRDATRAESRLAAADALLSESWGFMNNEGINWFDSKEDAGLLERSQSHLSENAMHNSAREVGE